MTINYAVKDEDTELVSCWLQSPLPFRSGDVHTVVIFNTGVGRVAVEKEWFDRVIACAPDGRVMWRWLLTLLEEQVAQTQMAFSQPPFDTEVA